MAQATLSTYGGLLLAPAYAGMVADMSPVTTDSRANEAAVMIDFGKAVARGANAATCKAPAADGDKIIGISIRHAINMPVNGVQGFYQTDEVPILMSGKIWCLAAENVTEGDAVLSLTAGNGTLGGTTGGAAGAGRVAVPNATWEATTTSGNLGIIRINR